MPKKPKYVMKPARFYATETGFQFSGEGIITEYEKGSTVVGNKVTLYVIMTNRALSKPNIFKLKLRKWTGYITVSQARENIDLNPYGKFSRSFKIALLKCVFTSKDTKTVDAFIEDMKGHEELF